MTLFGLPLRYLIGADNVRGKRGEIIVAPYMQSVLTRDPIVAGYCNLFDEENSGEFGPYMKAGDTASEWGEGQIDPDGAGWLKNLEMQFQKRKSQSITIVELDNADSYDSDAVIGAYDLAKGNGLSVLVKNPVNCDDPDALVKHKSAVGIIVERDSGSVAEIADLRPDGMPVWFVFDSAGRAIAQQYASQIRARGLKGMGVTYSTRGGEDQYNDSVDVLLPSL